MTGFNSKREAAANKLQEPEREALKLALEALKDLLDQTETPPDINCSCHIAPPCADCTDYSGIRYAIKQANTTLTTIKEALAQPAQEPRNVRERWNVELDGNDLLVCFNDHEKGDKCQYERYSPQREWIWLSDADIAEVVDTTCQYTGSYEEFLIKKAERKSRSMNNG